MAYAMGLQSGVHAQLDHCRDDPHNQPAGEIFFGSTIDRPLEGFAPMDLRLCSGEGWPLGLARYQHCRMAACSESIRWFPAGKGEAAGDRSR